MDEQLGFHEMGLDCRLLQNIASLGWETPTLFQEKAIPLVLEGRDVLGRGKTGCGKTGAFLIPIIHKLLMCEERKICKNVRALIIVPSIELSKQTTLVIRSLSPASEDITCIELCLKGDLTPGKLALLSRPDVVVGTPVRILSHIREGHLDLQSLQYLVLDEADLLHTYEFSQDVTEILSYLPAVYQVFLTSATLSEEVRNLKKLILRNAVTMKVDEPVIPSRDKLSQYVFKLNEINKLMVLVALFKFHCINGKSVIFVSAKRKAVRLKYFLEKLGIKCQELTNWVPDEDRCQIVMDFNNNKHSLLIMSDECLPSKHVEELSAADLHDLQRKKKGVGLSRGIDFLYVKNVISFDFPTQIENYIHRVGRTARGTNSGIAVFFVCPEELKYFTQIDCTLKLMMGMEESSFQEFDFDLQKLEGLRYRIQSVWDQCSSEVAQRVISLRQQQHSITVAMLDGELTRDAGCLKLAEIKRTLSKLEKGAKNTFFSLPDYLIPSELQNSSDISVDDVSQKASKKKKKRKWQRRKKSLANFEAEGKKNLQCCRKRKKVENRVCDPILTGEFSWNSTKMT